MDFSISYNDDEHIESVRSYQYCLTSIVLTTQQHLSKAQCLEMAYQETLRNTEMIIKDEGTRRLRLQILMLENENDDLHEQLALGDDRIDVLEQESEELRGQLGQGQENVCRQEAELRAQARELQNLKVSSTFSHVKNTLTSLGCAGLDERDHYGHNEDTY
jgi:peptidoglycan hydrolase CwlO-like protein